MFNENHKNLGKVNSFLFIKTLSKLTKTNTNIVTDMGTSFTCTMQSMSLKKIKDYLPHLD